MAISHLQNARHLFTRHVFARHLFARLFVGWSVRLCWCAFAAVVVVFFVGAVSPFHAAAQHLMNDGSGRITNSTTGIIRIRTNIAELRNTNASLTALVNAGVIELLGENNQFTATNPANAFGASSTRRIGGLVRYASNNAGGRQFLSNYRYYANLEVTGASVKFIQDGIRVGGDTLASALQSVWYLGSGVYRVSGGRREYLGTFYYDNARSQTLLTGENYDALELQRGAASLDSASLVFRQTNGYDPNAKIIPAGTTVQTRSRFRQAGSETRDSAAGQSAANASGIAVFGTLIVGTKADFGAGGGTVFVGAVNPSTLGAGTLTLGADTARFGANVLLASGILSASASASSMTGGAAAVIIVDSSATVRLIEASPQPQQRRGLMELTAGQRLIIRGGFVNAVPSRTNVRWNVASTISYTGTQPQGVAPTTATNPYGNFAFEGGTKFIGSTTGITSVGAGSGATVQRDSLPMIVVAGSVRGASALDLTNARVTREDNTDTAYTSGFRATLTMTNPSATAEYEGLGEVRGAMNRLLNRTTTAYTFNNAQTIITFTDGDKPEEMTLDVRGGAPPRAYQATSDVRRSIVWSWNDDRATSAPPNRDWTVTARIGYAASDVAAPFSTQNQIRLTPFEAYGTAQGDTARLLGTRTQPTRRSASATELGFVEFVGVQPRLPSDAISTNRFTSGYDLLLRADIMRRTVLSLRDGRWSNPNTWSIGREPDSADAVEVRHVVHCGFRRMGLDGMAAGGQIAERMLVARTSPGAATVKIAGDGALLIGSVEKSEGGFDDEISPQASWLLASGQVRVENAVPVAVVENVTRTGLMNEMAGARRNTRTDYRGLLLFQLLAGDKAVVKMSSLVNLGSIFNGGSLRISDE